MEQQSQTTHTAGPQNPFEQPHQSPRRSQRGCFFWGCLGCGGVMLVSVICVGVGAYILFHRFFHLVVQNEPWVDWSYQPSLNDTQELKQILEEAQTYFLDDPFAQVIPLRLTESQINTLFALYSDNDSRTQIRFMSDEKLQMMFSFRFEEKYINVEVTGQFALRDNQVKAVFDQFKIGTWRFPQWVVQSIIEDNQFKDELLSDEKFHDLKYLEAFFIENDMLHIYFSREGFQKLMVEQPEVFGSENNHFEAPVDDLE